MISVYVCIASAGTWLSETAVSVVDLCTSWLTEAKDFPNRTGGIRIYDGCNIATNRYRLVNMALEANATHVLFLDADMTYPRDTIARLLRHNKHIVGANGPKRCHPIQGTTIGFDGVQFKTTEEHTGIQKVKAIGTGCMLINTEVFTKIKEPWFEHRWVEDLEKFVGSDVFFCIMAQKAGYEVFVDHDISKEIAHIGTYPYMFKEEYNNVYE